MTDPPENDWKEFEHQQGICELQFCPYCQRELVRQLWQLTKERDG